MRTRILLAILLALLVVTAAYESYEASRRAHTAVVEQCALDACPFDITAADSGRTFTYRETTRFTVHLNQDIDPVEHLACTPEGIIGVIADTPATRPEYDVRYEAVKPGSCTLASDHFHSTIVVAPLQQ